MNTLKKASRIEHQTIPVIYIIVFKNLTCTILLCKIHRDINTLMVHEKRKKGLSY